MGLESKSKGKYHTHIHTNTRFKMLGRHPSHSFIWVCWGEAVMEFPGRALEVKWAACKLNEGTGGVLRLNEDATVT